VDGDQQKYNGSKDFPSKVALVPAERASPTFGSGFPHLTLLNKPLKLNFGQNVPLSSIYDWSKSILALKVILKVTVYGSGQSPPQQQSPPFPSEHGQ
jgi:hypothetical protein